MCIYVFMHMCVRVLAEDRRSWMCRSWSYKWLEPPDVGTGNQAPILWKSKHLTL